MKKISLTLFVLLIALTSKSFAQKLEVNSTDAFTKKLVKQTSWETLLYSMKGNAYYSISLNDTTETLDFKFQNNQIHTIMQGDQITFALANGDVVSLPCILEAVACKGCGARGMNGSGTLGIHTSFSLFKEQIQKLKASKIVKIKIGFATGEVVEDVKDKYAEDFQACLNLL